MNTLVSVMTSLSEAKTNKDAAKNRWLEAMEQGGEDVSTLKQAFLAADDIWTAGRAELEKTIQHLQGIFCFQIALSLLDREQTQTLQTLLIEQQLEHLTDPYSRPNLPELCRCWYKAEGMREASKTMMQRFANREEGEAVDSILTDLDRARKPEAWSATVETYNFIQAAMLAGGTDESGDQLASAVLHYLSRHLLKQYDDLTEKLSDKLEDLHYANALSTLLEELDEEPELRRAIQDAAASGLIRLRQTQVEEQTETRPVATIFADPDSDSEIDPEADPENWDEEEQ